MESEDQPMNYGRETEKMPSANMIESALLKDRNVEVRVERTSEIELWISGGDSTRCDSFVSNGSVLSKLTLDSSTAKLSFLLFGIGSVVPQRAITASLSFFEIEYAPYEPQFSFNLAISLPTFVMQLLLFVYLQKIPLQARIGGMFSIFSVVCVLMVVTPAVFEKNIAYWTSLLLCAVIGTAYAILQVSIYEVAGPCAALTNNLMLGIGLAANLVNCVRILFLATIPTDFELSAEVFFLVAALFLVLCSILAFTFIRKYQKAQ